MARFDEQLADGPALVVDHKATHRANLTVSGVNRIAHDRLHAAEMLVVSVMDVLMSFQFIL